MAGFDDWRGDPPAMPSGNGRLEKPKLLYCSRCAWIDTSVSKAVDHWRESQHDVYSAKGIKQDFSRFAVTREELVDRR